MNGLLTEGAVTGEMVSHKKARMGDCAAKKLTGVLSRPVTA